MSRRPLFRAVNSSSSGEFQKSLRYGLQSVLARLGVPGILGVGLLVFCAMIWGSALWKLTKEQAEIEAELRTPMPLEDRSRIDDLQAQLTAFQAVLPEKSQIAALVGQIHAYADASSVRLSSTEFHLAEPTLSSASAMPAFVVTLDTTASHEASVKFINSVLAQMPNIALEGLAVKRTKLADSVLETQLRFRLFVRTP